MVRPRASMRRGGFHFSSCSPSREEPPEKGFVTVCLGYPTIDSGRLHQATPWTPPVADEENFGPVVMSKLARVLCRLSGLRSRELLCRLQLQLLQSELPGLQLRGCIRLCL